MIAPADIRQKAENQYPAFLRSSVTGEPFFPLAIRFRKPKATADYLELRAWVEALLAGSKRALGYGYTLELQTRETRRYGRQSLPARITIESAADYLELIGKADEFAQFQAAVAHTHARLPQLEAWLAQYPQRVLRHLDAWADLMEVCAYFLAHPRPHGYIRELPIPVHTKFVEEHTGILRLLLDELLPAEAIRAGETHFERRYGLRYDEALVRLRLLDEKLRSDLGWPAADLSLPLSACAALPPAGRRVFIVENKMTFLTLPAVADSLAIWGVGYGVGNLRYLAWLSGCEIFYWGDLDVQGFEILAQVRAYFPQTRSLMMDAETLAAFAQFAVAGTAGSGVEPAHLTPAEAAVYRRLAAESLRLEQEKIDQAFVRARVRSLDF